MKTFKELKYIIKYSNRKNSVAMNFSKDPFEIRVPKGTSERKVEKLIEREYPKISKLYKKYESIIRKYNHGEEVFIYGKKYIVNIIIDKSNFIEILENKINFYVEEDIFDLKYKLFTKYLKKISYLETKRLVKKYSKVMNVYPNQVKINSATTRWGSCNDSLGNLNFSLRLAMLPEDVQEYIVIHELAHFIEFNHSPDFWRVVKKYMPDYKEKEFYLKTNQYKFIIK